MHRGAAANLNNDDEPAGDSEVCSAYVLVTLRGSGYSDGENDVA